MNFSILIILSLLAISCNTNKGNTLAGGFVQPSTCPDSGCADLTPLAEKMHIETTTEIQVRRDQKTLEITGRCNPSTYPKNRIEMTFPEEFIRPHYAASDPATPEVPQFNANAFSSPLLTTCFNGRFFAVLSVIESFTSILEMDVRIIGIDSDNIEHTSELGSTSKIHFSKIQ